MKPDTCLRRHAGWVLGCAAVVVALGTGCERCERAEGATRVEPGAPPADARPAASTEAGPEAVTSAQEAEAGEDDTDYSRIDLPDPPTPPDLRSGEAGPKRDQSVFDGYGLPWHPTAVHLCGKRLLHPGGEQSVWDAFWSEASPQKLVADYRLRLGERGFTAEAPGGIWKLPEGAPTPRRKLRILQVSSPGEHKSCDETPPPRAKSVLILTRH